MKRALRVLCVSAFCVVLPASHLAGQEARANNRVGLWGGFGMGGGLLGCLESGCSHDEWGFSLDGRLGGTFSPSLRLAGGINGYYKEIDGTDLTVGVTSFQVLWYPNEGDFYLLAGAGFAWSETSYAYLASSGFVTLSETDEGAGFVLGLGYDLVLNRSGSLALTPFASWTITTIDPTLDFLELGLGLTFN